MHGGVNGVGVFTDCSRFPSAFGWSDLAIGWGGSWSLLCGVSAGALRGVALKGGG